MVFAPSFGCDDNVVARDLDPDWPRSSAFLLGEALRFEARRGRRVSRASLLCRFALRERAPGWCAVRLLAPAPRVHRALVAAWRGEARRRSAPPGVRRL